MRVLTALSIVIGGTSANMEPYQNVHTYFGSCYLGSFGSYDDCADKGIANA